MRFAPIIIFAAIASLAATAAAGSGAACGTATNTIVAARFPEVDLYDGQVSSESAPLVKTISRDQFPNCSPILEQAKNSMLKVSIDGKAYWVNPTTVTYNGGAPQKIICSKWASNSDDQTKVGSTQGLGQGCHGDKATPK